MPREDDPALSYDELIKLTMVPVCSPKLIERHGPLDAGAALARVPLIHDDSLAGRAGVPTWQDWVLASGIDIGDISRGLRFTSADHALDAALEGAGLLLAHSILAYDDLQSGRLVMPFDMGLPANRAYHFVTPKVKLKSKAVLAFRGWVLDEMKKVHERDIKPPPSPHASRQTR